MITRHFVSSLSENLPLLGLGGMRLPTDSSGEIDFDKGRDMIDLCMKNGVNYFDTAYPYHDGKSEVFFRKALVERYDREDFFLADKMPEWIVHSRDDAKRIFDEQLEKCGVEYFDFYLLHALNKERIENLKSSGCEDFLLEMKKEGKIKHFGFSFHDTPQTLKSFIDPSKHDFVQLQINYLDWDTQSASQSYEIASQLHIPLIVMEPIRGGFLADVPKIVSDVFDSSKPGISPARWALSFPAGLENVAVVLSGMSNVDQLKENIDIFTDFENLPRDIYPAAAKAMMSLGAITCTACNYCSVCPQGIPIPKIFKAYNDFNMTKNKFLAKFAYFIEIDEEHRGDKCIGCHACEKQCPQKIEIVELIKKIHSEFEPFQNLS